jgi:hypothetical protein
MRVGSLQRQRKSSILPVIGGCLAVYAVCAVGFHALVEPSLGKNQPPPPPVLEYSAAALAARAESVAPAPVAASQPASKAAPVTAPKAAAKTAAKVAPAATPVAPPAAAMAPAPTATTAPTPAVVPTPAVALAPAAAPAADLAPAAAPTMALMPAATPAVAADATADTAEKPAVVYTVEAPKKPARKRVAAPKPQPGFFDFFSGGFNNNARASNTRSRSAQSNGGYRPFF